MTVFIPKQNKATKTARKSKYGNRRVEYMRMMFDSIGERDRYIYLKDCELRGEIKDLKCQVSYKLEINDVLICRYIADFEYRTTPFDLSPGSVNLSQVVVEDFKGVETAVFKLKAKLMFAIYGVSVRVVKSPTAVIG